MMVRRVALSIASLAVFAYVHCAAASLGGISGASIGADSTVVASCDTDGVTTSYTTSYDGTAWGSLHRKRGRPEPGAEAGAGLWYFAGGDLRVHAGVVREPCDGVAGRTLAPVLYGYRVLPGDRRAWAS